MFVYLTGLICVPLGNMQALPSINHVACQETYSRYDIGNSTFTQIRHELPYYELSYGYEFSLGALRRIVVNFVSNV
jgi:hypothetical protein